MTDQEKEIKRVISYIRSCRDAGIDTTITIDKTRNHFILNALEEIQQYREIGTVEECREARERHRAKKPTPIDYEKYIGVVNNAECLRGAYWCPNCKHAIRSGDYCNDCGQAIDWSDTD